jgi:NADPH:quinone reductase-like Zn-dependent oxidoreductase
MQAAVVNALGQPPRYQEFAEPVPTASEVLIHVVAAGLHPVVKAIASGSHYSFTGGVPMIAGIDAVGTRPDGARVYFGSPRRPWGTMAERCAAPAAMCLRLPEGISDVQAAAIANPGMSALLSLKERAAVAAGETVLILGATGVAGQLAIQIARYLGAKRIIAAGRNVDAIAREDVDSIVALGEPEERVRDAFTAEAAAGIDVVIDYLWGRPTELLLEALEKGFNPTTIRSTRLVEVGESAGKTIRLPGAALRSLDLKLLGSGFGAVPLKTIFSAIPTLFDMAAAGTLHVDVEPVPLTDVEGAWGRVEKGRRIVFTI